MDSRRIATDSSALVRRCLQHVDIVQAWYPYLHRYRHRCRSVDVHPVAVLVSTFAASSFPSLLTAHAHSGISFGSARIRRKRSAQRSRASFTDTSARNAAACGTPKREVRRSRNLHVLFYS